MTDISQTPQQIATTLEDYLAQYPAAVLAEDGKVLFDFRTAKYTLSPDTNRVTLHLWSEDRNLVRRVSAATLRAKTLRLTTHKFGQTKPSTLELTGDNSKDRRTPTNREQTRTRFLKPLERALERHFESENLRPESFRTAMDLEKSFGPAYARGLLVHAARAFAVIAINDEEAPTTIDGILTFGILWLEACRTQAANHRRTIAGLKIVVPRGHAALTLARIAWLATPTQFQLLELDQREETLNPRDPTDSGNTITRLRHAPNPTTVTTRFAESAARLLALVPLSHQSEIDQRLRTPTELCFLLHGLEFARIRLGASAESFNSIEQITFGAGPAETQLTALTEPHLRELVARLCERRTPTANTRDPLFRLQPERWLESQVRRHLLALDPHLDPTHLYAEVAAFAAGNSGSMDRGMLDLLTVSASGPEAGRLAIIELKAAEDPQLAFQGLDYWLRVRAHHTAPPDLQSGLGDFQRHGYFADIPLSPLPPRLLLAAPALHIHPATDTILRYLSPAVEWTLLALDERWRLSLRVTWRKRSTDQPTTPSAF